MSLFRSKIIISLVTFSLMLILWELSINWFDISAIILCKPSQIFPVILSKADIFLSEMLFSGQEILMGWFVGNITAFVLSFFTYKLKKISKILISFSVLLNAVPLVALSAILGGIFGTGIFGKTVIVSILCFFPMFITTQNSFINIKYKELALFRTYAADQKEIFQKLILPKSLPSIFNTLKLNVINSVFAAIVSEFFGAFGGIGNLILSKKGIYDLEMVWGAIFYLIIATLLFYFLIDLVYKIIIPWRRK